MAGPKGPKFVRNGFLRPLGRSSWFKSRRKALWPQMCTGWVILPYGPFMAHNGPQKAQSLSGTDLGDQWADYLDSKGIWKPFGHRYALAWSICPMGPGPKGLKFVKNGSQRPVGWSSWLERHMIALWPHMCTGLVILHFVFAPWPHASLAGLWRLWGAAAIRSLDLLVRLPCAT